jgi:hypothetical protein
VVQDGVDVVEDVPLGDGEVDRLFRQVGIDGLTAEGVEVFEAADQGGIAAALFVDDLLYSHGEFRDALGKLADGLFPRFAKSA